ncbi:TrbC family F-type conjugative pilus assembly protein [Psittacicella gerlachiana]|uniref:Uncharacterized protein n=1 Tax=Psittacicella gerlachiana TaxID=2028574 RepID=A0A3A1YCK9_9GAMM|nr:TrbC family F-type conjugative pilus assembly protein [Psittacicella gerlachiana]RIY35872.1 hypothetical protein CKF59_03165 [Psittacicella gerlachiana]
MKKLIILGFCLVWGVSLSSAKEIKASYFWQILVSQSLPDQSLANIFRYSLEQKIPLVFPGVLHENWSQGIVELQQRVARIVAQYQLEQVPEISIDPRPFGSIKFAQVPALVLFQSLKSTTLHGSLRGEQITSVYEQYGNLSLDLAQLQAKISLPTNNLQRLALGYQQRVKLYLQQARQPTPQKLGHPFGAGSYYLPLEQAQVVSQGQVFKISEPEMRKQAQTKLKQYLQEQELTPARAWLEPSLQSMQKAKEQFLAPQQGVLELSQQQRLVLLPYLLPTAQAFPLELWFIDLKHRPLAKFLAQQDPKKLHQFFQAGSRVVILTGLSCAEQKQAQLEAQACFAWWQEQLGVNLHLALPELLRRFKPTALTRVAHAQVQELKQKSWLARFGELVEIDLVAQELLAEGEQQLRNSKSALGQTFEGKSQVTNSLGVDNQGLNPQGTGRRYLAIIDFSLESFAQLLGGKS